MNRGYVKLWRKTFDAGWLQNHKLCVFWLWCLLKASYKEYDLIVGCQQVHLMPGDFVFGLNKASEELDMSIRSIRTILAFLKTSQNLTIKTTNKFSIISIVNWDTYQQTENTNDTQNDKLPTNNRQATDNKQECKEHKNIKNSNIPKINFAENIKLTQEEFDKLVSLKTKPTSLKAIQYLSEYKIEKSYKTQSDYLTIKRWVFEAVEKQGGNSGNRQTFNTNKRNYGADRELSQEANDMADEINRKYYAAKAAAAGEPKKDA